MGKKNRNRNKHKGHNSHQSRPQSHQQGAQNQQASPESNQPKDINRVLQENATVQEAQAQRHEPVIETREQQVPTPQEEEKVVKDNSIWSKPDTSGGGTSKIQNFFASPRSLTTLAAIVILVAVALIVIFVPDYGKKKDQIIHEITPEASEVTVEGEDVTANGVSGIGEIMEVVESTEDTEAPTEAVEGETTLVVEDEVKPKKEKREKKEKKERRTRNAEDAEDIAMTTALSAPATYEEGAYVYNFDGINWELESSEPRADETKVGFYFDNFTRREGGTPVNFNRPFHVGWYDGKCAPSESYPDSMDDNQGNVIASLDCSEHDFNISIVQDGNMIVVYEKYHNADEVLLVREIDITTIVRPSASLPDVYHMVWNELEDDQWLYVRRAAARA